jgi:type II secretory pathway component PulF
MLAPPYEKLSRFAGNLATCLESGVEIKKSLETAKRSLAHTPLAGAMEVVVMRVDRGDSLATALAAAEWGLPPFFVPMVQAGEQTGRVDESLRYLEHHCKMIAGPAQALQNAWLLPLTVAVAGTAIKLAAYLLLAPWSTTLSFAWASLKFYTMLGAAAFLVLGSPVKPLFDQLKLLLPFISSIEQETAANRFFHAFAMLYAAAGRRVDEMIDFSCRTVPNVAIRRDLLAVARRIKAGTSLPEAFRPAVYLAQEQKDLIATGDLSGTLEKSFERISNDAAEKLKVRLGLVQLIFSRVVFPLIAYSVLTTLISLVWLSYQ